MTNIFGEIADSILIGGACIAADIECAFSSIGINKRAREVGKNNKKDNESVTDMAPNNPQQNTNTHVENDSTFPINGDTAAEETLTPEKDSPISNNDGESDPPKKKKHKNSKTPENPITIPWSLLR